MTGRGIVKRFIPFFLTFAAGLFIASFFVSLTAPSFPFGRSAGRHDCGRIKAENEYLRSEIDRLRKENADLYRLNSELNPAFEVPPPPPPPMPIRPMAPRHIR